MSVVLQCTMTLPSALTLTMAMEVVGEIDALKPTAMPRPRRMLPSPRSNGPGQLVQHAVDVGIHERRADRLRPPVLQDVPAAVFQRVDAEFAGDQVGVALIGPDQLRNAEAPQRACRRPVGIEREGIDADVLDIVGARRRESGFLRHPGSDIRVGTAIPQHLAMPRHEPARIVDAALDAEGAGMLGDRVELLLHGLGVFDWAVRQQRQRRRQRLGLDINLGPEAAAKEGYPHPHLVLRPAEQARDLDPHEGRTLA
jgi:hypothetical protein